MGDGTTDGARERKPRVERKSGEFVWGLGACFVYNGIELGRASR